ncbi:hypothetical protein B0H16DRAFT_1828947 [Mycena metata]|uniref:F-box domain-containing protein n=1 Tax=Mycena metata TaxID=1033252 RepID=A0AAD7NDE0_9AGAR|nr:hypothetical protein B0H16DRAFT_1828947 [Mycena metata]
MQALAVGSVGRVAESFIAVGDWQGTGIKTGLGRFPTEILCEIFRSTLPWKRRHNNTHLLTPPWVLGLVCRRWRECALGDVKLWMKIEIDCTGLMTETKIIERFPLAALETQIVRSGTAPLDIKFESSRTPWASDYISCLLELLVQQRNRWGRLDLTFLHIFPLVLTQVKGNLQSLEHLTFCSAPLPPQIHDVFEIAPQLRDVTMINDSEDTDRWDAPVLSAPWEQITRYRGSFSAEICVDILCRAELLVECGLHDSGNDMSPGTSLAILPRLRRLAVAHPRVLKFLKTPNLEYLFLDLNRELGDVTDSVVAFTLAFLGRSQCQLKGITAEDCLANDLHSILKSTPTLLHLHADFCDEIGTSTTRLLQDTDVCPRLTSIHLGWLCMSCSEAVYDFIVARKRTLKFASISTGDRIAEFGATPDLMERLLALRSDLLKVTVVAQEQNMSEFPLSYVTKDMDPFDY